MFSIISISVIMAAAATLVRPLLSHPEARVCVQKGEDRNRSSCTCKTTTSGNPGHNPGCTAAASGGRCCSLPCPHITRVQHEDAARGLSLIHNRSKGQVFLVQGDLQGLAAPIDEEEGAQESHAFREHFFREGRDTLLWGKGDFHFTDFFGLQGDVPEGHQGDDLDKVTLGLSS